LVKSHPRPLILAAIVLVFISLFFLNYSLTHADTSITLTINGGLATGGKTITVPKNSCVAFALDTITTTDDVAGYNIKAYGKTTDNNIAIKKQDDTEISTDPNTPTEIISTTTIASNDKKTTTYKACASDNIADGNYNTEIAYIISENIVPCVYGPQFKGDVGNMQNIDTSTWNVGDTGIAIDTRNNQEYCIGKLKDNKVWMLDNLKLELTEGVILTPATTNVSEDKTVGFDWDSFTSTHVNHTHNNNFVTQGYLTVSGSIGDGANNNAWRQVDPSMLNWSNNVNCRHNGSNRVYDPNSKTGCGYLYNFYTATASTAAGVSSGTASGSICPSSWKLPSGQTSNGDFGVLDAAYPPGTGSSHNLDSPDAQMLWPSAGAWRGAMGGRYELEAYGVFQGQVGYYWPSSIYGSTAAYHMYFSGSSVVTGTNIISRYYGLAVRCLVS
jgi:uncharacterized protein (TIGR02145 family)